jgi:hypothetical protein
MYGRVKLVYIELEVKNMILHLVFRFSSAYNDHEAVVSGPVCTLQAVRSEIHQLVLLFFLGPQAPLAGRALRDKCFVFPQVIITEKINIPELSGSKQKI